MKKSNRLAIACSAVLAGAFAISGVAQERSDERANNQPAQSQQQQQSSAHGKVAQNAGQSRDVVVAGRITDARDVKLAETAGDEHRLFKVKPERGQEIIVDIGVPRGELSQASFTTGDRIVAIGKPARINGKPVLFAAHVAEMQRVGRVQASSGSTESGSAANRQTNPQSSQPRQNEPRQSAASGGRATIVYFFDTDNFGEDDYGYYDEDFAWTADDSRFDAWNDTNGLAWQNVEQAHYDLFGYDDAGEGGLWDW